MPESEKVRLENRGIVQVNDQNPQIRIASDLRTSGMGQPNYRNIHARPGAGLLWSSLSAGLRELQHQADKAEARAYAEQQKWENRAYAEQMRLQHKAEAEAEKMAAMEQTVIGMKGVIKNNTDFTEQMAAGTLTSEYVQNKTQELIEASRQLGPAAFLAIGKYAMEDLTKFSGLVVAKKTSDHLALINDRASDTVNTIFNNLLADPEMSDDLIESAWSATLDTLKETGAPEESHSQFFLDSAMSFAKANAGTPAGDRTRDLIKSGKWSPWGDKGHDAVKTFLGNYGKLANQNRDQEDARERQDETRAQEERTNRLISQLMQEKALGNNAYITATKERLANPEFEARSLYGDTGLTKLFSDITTLERVEDQEKMRADDIKADEMIAQIETEGKVYSMDDLRHSGLGATARLKVYSAQVPGRVSRNMAYVEAAKQVWQDVSTALEAGKAGFTLNMKDSEAVSRFQNFVTARAKSLFLSYGDTLPWNEADMQSTSNFTNKINEKGKLLTQEILSGVHNREYAALNEVTVPPATAFTADPLAFSAIPNKEKLIDSVVFPDGKYNPEAYLRLATQEAIQIANDLANKHAAEKKAKEAADAISVWDSSMFFRTIKSPFSFAYELFKAAPEMGGNLSKMPGAITEGVGEMIRGKDAPQRIGVVGNPDGSTTVEYPDGTITTIREGN
jgi:hypothetical protein